MINLNKLQENYKVSLHLVSGCSCGCMLCDTNHLKSVICGLLLNMDGDLFSLEDDDCSQLFITQQPSQNICEIMDKSWDNNDSGNETFLGLSADDFNSPCVSLANKSDLQGKYLDISDAEDFCEYKDMQKEHG